MEYQDVTFSGVDGAPITNLSLVCSGVSPPPPAPPPSVVVFEVDSNGEVVDDTVVVQVTLSSDEALVSSFQFTIVSLGCLGEAPLLSVSPSSGQGRIDSVKGEGCESRQGAIKVRFWAGVVVVVLAGSVFGSNELVFSQETLIVAATFISTGPLELGEASLDLVFDGEVSLPICLEEVIVSSAVGGQVGYRASRHSSFRVV